MSVLYSRSKQKLQRDRRRKKNRPPQSAKEKADLDYDDYGSSAVSATSATGTTAPSDVGSADLVSRYVCG